MTQVISESEYEFSSDHNQVIGDTATKIQHVAILLFLIGVVMLIQFIFDVIQGVSIGNIVSSILSAALSIYLGYLFYQASGNLNSIQQTQGRDVSSLIQAILNLNGFYAVMWIALIIGALANIVNELF